MTYLRIQLLLLIHKLGFKKLSSLDLALYHPIYTSHTHRRFYSMNDEDDNDHWELIYYPLLHDVKTGEEYGEPKALLRNINKPGFWSKEVPLRYVSPISDNDWEHIHSQRHSEHKEFWDNINLLMNMTESEYIKQNISEVKLPDIPFNAFYPNTITL
jgi:hypothetical protein